MTRYTDEFRASAVLMLEAAGYPGTKGALARVSRAQKVPARTLSRWLRKESNPPPDKNVSEKRPELIAAIREELHEILGEFKNTRGDADYRALATAFGILVDKHELLAGNATARIEHSTAHKIAQAVRDGNLTFEELEQELGRDLATNYFERAGVPVAQRAEVTSESE